MDGVALSSSFDAVGRRSARTTAYGQVSTWSYDAAGRPASLALGDRQLSFGRDAAGRETYRWIGPEVALTSEWDAAGAVLPDGQTWRYRYDSLGRRIAKQRLGSGVHVSVALAARTSCPAFGPQHRDRDLLQRPLTQQVLTAQQRPLNRYFSGPGGDLGGWPPGP